MKITDALVQRLMKKWWVRLGLEDWRISWEWLSDAELNENFQDYKASAYTQRQPAERTAQISLSSEVSWVYPGITSEIDTDLERVVLHELAHIYFMPQDEFMNLADDLTDPYLPAAVRTRNWSFLTKAREGYVRSFVELMLRQERENEHR